MRGAFVNLVVLGVLAATAPLASAQPGKTSPAPQPVPGPTAGPPGAQPAVPNAQRREEIKRKIRGLRAYALTSELSLDDRTGARVWPVLAKFDDEVDKLLQQRIDLHRQLRGADQWTDPVAQNRLVDAVIANQKAFWSVEERRTAELRKLLSPSQMTRLLVVLPAFERKIQNQLRRAIVRKAGQDTDSDDDDLEDEDPRGRGRRFDDAPHRFRRR